MARGLQHDGDLYIMDEPLTYVDKEYTELIKTFIYTQFKDKTVIIISHSDDIMEECTKIYHLLDTNLVIQELDREIV